MEAMVLWRLLQRYTTCKLRGHISTGTFLWWMCDRCHSTFTPASSHWENGVKISEEKNAKAE